MKTLLIRCPKEKQRKYPEVTQKGDATEKQCRKIHRKNPEEVLSRIAKRCFQLGWQKVTCPVTGSGKTFSSCTGFGYHILHLHDIQHGLKPVELQVTVIPPSSGVTPMSVYHGMPAAN